MVEDFAMARGFAIVGDFGAAEDLDRIEKDFE